MSEENKPEVEEKPAIEPETEAALNEKLSEFEPEAEGGAGKSEEAPKVDAQGVAMVAMFYSGAFSVLSSRLGEHWKLSDDEAQALAAPTLAVINKYAPGIKTGPEAVLLGVAAMIVLPRVQVTAELARDDEGKGGGSGDKPEH